MGHSNPKETQEIEVIEKTPNHSKIQADLRKLHAKQYND